MGFTLLELLIVVAIVTILAGLLFPAVGATREHARKISCMNNLQQMGKAAYMYAMDNGAYLMPGAYDMHQALPGPIPAGGHWRWHGWRKSGYDLFDPRMGCLAKYLGMAAMAEPRTPRELAAYVPPQPRDVLKMQGLKMCPTYFSYFKGEVNSSSNAFESGAGGYGYNRTYVGGSAAKYGVYDPRTNETPATMSRFRNPARTVMFADAALAQKKNGMLHYVEESEAYAPLMISNTLDGNGEEQPDWGFATPTVHFRHRGFANVLWMDLHVSSKRLEWTVPGAYGLTLAEQTKMDIGWFGPKDNSFFRYK